uniref:Uncharacterized protein n=1 Tax=Glossina austeni TaxID=7395 RepID=A0A1A9UGA5_GLOAU
MRRGIGSAITCVPDFACDSLMIDNANLSKRGNMEIVTAIPESSRQEVNNIISDFIHPGQCRQIPLPLPLPLPLPSFKAMHVNVYVMSLIRMYSNWSIVLTILPWGAVRTPKS